MEDVTEDRVEPETGATEKRIRWRWNAVEKIFISLKDKGKFRAGDIEKAYQQFPRNQSWICSSAGMEPL